MASYYEAQLVELVTQVAEATDRYRDGELETCAIDHVLFQYSRAAKELLKFCNLGDVEMTAHQTRDGPTMDWWKRGGRSPGRHADLGRTDGRYYVAGASYHRQ